MQAEGYRRARKLLTSRGDYVTAGCWGPCNRCSWCFFWALLRYSSPCLRRGAKPACRASKVGGLPDWIKTRITGEDPATACSRIQASARSSPEIWPGTSSIRPSAALWDSRRQILPSLRSNLGALATLLGLGLACIILISIVAIWRRRVIAKAATDVAAALRRQIHRQMYRLGQSSLPTEGVGPVINLWTREVNDVRDGVVADLDATPRLHVLAGGLLVIALLVSPILTFFLASLGILVWLIARVLDRDARQANEVALRDVSVQLCLLHEDLGLLRTIRVYGVSEFDRQRFDEHLARYEQADARRIITSMPLNPSTGLLYGAGVAIALGCWATTC